MTSAAGTPGGNPAPPFSVPPNKVGEEATAAAALAAVGGGMTQSPAAAQGPASAAGADLPLCDAADDEGTDDLGDPAMQRRNSGSLSTHDRSDWRGGSEGGGQRASGEQPLESPEDDQGQPQQRGRRNSRQQEQNKQVGGWVGGWTRAVAAWQLVCSCTNFKFGSAGYGWLAYQQTLGQHPSATQA